MTDLATSEFIVPGRRPEWWRLVMLGAVGLLGITAAATVAHALEGRASNQSTFQLTPVSPSSLVSVLARPQTSVDLISAQIPRGMVRSESTHYVGTTALGRHYAAVGMLKESVCLVTLSAISVPESACVGLDAFSAGLLFTTAPSSAGSIAFMADDHVLGAPWVRISPNLTYQPKP